MSKETFDAIQKFLIQEPFDVYNAQRKQYMASSALGTFRDESPCDYLYSYNLDVDHDSEAMLKGRAYHVIVLEGMIEYGNRFAWNSPVNSATGKPYGYDTKKFKDWALEAKAYNKQAITREHHDVNMLMREALYKNVDATKILKKGISEQVIRANYCNVKTQIRPDWLSPEYGITDLKTTKDLQWFLSDAKKYGYFGSAAYYRSVSRVVLSQAGLNFDDFPFFLIAQETKAPYKSAVYELSEGLLDRYETLNQRALKDFIECQKTGVWPTNTEGIELVE